MTTSGKSEAMLKALYVTLSRYLHRVTASVLHLLKYKAYTNYCQGYNENEKLTQEEWERNAEKEYSQFKFWNIIIRFELQLPELVGSLREGQFEDYIKSLHRITPWMFSLYHTHYVRWLPVHIRDLLRLKEHHPERYNAFNKNSLLF